LVAIFKQLTRNDTAKAKAVESDLKKTFPWIADVAFDSDEAVSKAVEGRFTQLAKADKRDVGVAIADTVIGMFTSMTKMKEIDRDQNAVLVKALSHVFKRLDEEVGNKED
jgi:hypothetical protein